MDKEYTPAEAKAWLAGYDAGKAHVKKEWKVLTELDMNKIIEDSNSIQLAILMTEQVLIGKNS
jgi:hypothetical protein